MRKTLKVEGDRRPCGDESSFILETEGADKELPRIEIVYIVHFTFSIVVHFCSR